MKKVLILGIDISNHQSKLDLDKLLTKHPEIKVVIIKSSEGVNYDDAYDEKFIRIALAHGCIVGVYHFARPDKNGWLAEAKFFLSLTLKYKGKVFYVLDWERVGSAIWAKNFLGYVAKETGSTPIFYSYESMINAHDFSSISRYPLWVAKYRDYVIDKNFDMSSAGNPPNVKWWDDYIGWQWTSVGRLDEYSGNLDCTAFYVDEETLKRCIAGADPVQEEQKTDPIDAVLKIAAGEVGYKEGANNHTKYGDEMHALQPRNMDKNAPWCDAFVDWCMVQAFGAETAKKVLCGDFDDYTYNSVALYKKAGRWSQTAHRGDQIFFGGSGHTGIVESVENGRVHTIEGNKGDMVKRCDYPASHSSIIGYGRPKYELVGTINTITEEYDMPTLKRGSQGKAVKVLQVILGGLEVDGSFGPKTQNAVLKFQSDHDLETDSVVGPLTWKALLNTL